MFTIDYNTFMNHSFYSDFKISYMPRLTISQAMSNNCKVIVNVDTKFAYIYAE